MSQFNPSAIGTLLLLLTLIAPVAAAGFTNGDFDTDLSGWSSVAGNGTVAWNAGQAVLETGSDTDAYSAVLVQGDDGFFTFTSPILLGPTDELLKIDASFVDLGIDLAETGVGSFFDHLSIVVYDADSFDQWLLGSVSLVAPGGADLLFDLTAPADLRGKRVAFSFELADEDDGRNSRASLDNVSLIPRPVSVPEPGTLGLLAGGLLALARRGRNARTG